MNQRSSFSRAKELRREKIIRTRRDDEERVCDDQPPRRSSTERPSSARALFYSRFKEYYAEKPHSNSRDGQGSIVFRRQDKPKGQYNYGKSSPSEVSPARVPFSNTVKTESSGRSNYGSYYSRGGNSREKDHAAKRSGTVDNNHIIDDARLHTFLHRLLRDEDKERQASMIRQLKVLFSQPENMKTILSNREDIILTFEDFIQLDLNSEIKQELVSTIGTFGAVLGIKAKGLLEWAFAVYNLSKSVDIGILILDTIHEMLKVDKGKGTLSELIPLMMSKLQSTLEVADVPELLVAIVNVVFEISNSYPLIFSKHFSDTVDILIGWHIDATQQSSVIEFASNTLIGFQQFWISDISFTATLLGQFLEDMESYAEELTQTKSNSSGSNENQSCSPSENIAKIKSLISVLITVLRSIGDMITPDDNGPITWSFITEMLKNFLKYVNVTVEYHYTCDLITSANECLILLLKLTQSCSKDALDELLSYIELLQSKPPCFLNDSHILSILSVMTTFVKMVETNLPVKFVTNLFSPSSLSRQLHLSPSPKVQMQLISLHHAVLSAKNVQVVEEFYQCIKEDIKKSYSVLLDFNTATDQELECAKASILFSVCALAEIGNIKHSIIRMFALKPSFFDLIITHLMPVIPDLAVKFPSLQSAVLYTLYSHSQRHSHFVNNSDIVNQNAVLHSPASSSGTNSPIITDVLPSSSTSNNLSKVLKLLVDLLTTESTPYDCRLLATLWTAEIFESVNHHLSRLIGNSQFDELLNATLNAGFIDNPTICKSCCKSLFIVLQYASSALPESFFQSCYELCLLRMTSHDSEIQNQFTSLLSLLPLNIILMEHPLNFSKSNCFLSASKEFEFTYKGIISSSDVWTLHRGYMSRSSSGNFYGHHFRTIMNFILQGKEPQGAHWLLHMFNTCPPPERKSRIDSLLKSLSGASTSILWFWAVWESAQTCVTSKLRTPLGKPQETFMAIEASLKSSAQHYKTEDNTFIDDSEHGLLRINLLLSFIEQLEKLMYNAYEGCAVALSSPPKNVRTFFRTNKSTCYEWLSRIRSTAMTVALNAGCPAAAIRHGSELLKELKNNGVTQGTEFENALFSIVKALIHLRCPEAILGIYIWCKETLGCKFTWIKAAVESAAGRFENAASEYMSALQSVYNKSNAQNQASVVISSEGLKKEPDLSFDFLEFLSKIQLSDISSAKSVPAHLNSFLCDQVIDCYVNLGSWSDAAKWAEIFYKIKFNQNGVTLQNRSNLSYLRSLTTYDAFSKVCNSNEHTSVYSSAGNIADCSIIYNQNIQEQFSNAQNDLILSVLDFLGNIKSSFNPQYCELKDLKISEANDRIINLMKIATLNWPPHINPKHIAVLIFASAIQSPEQLTRLFFQDYSKLDPSDYCSSTYSLLLTWQSIWSSANPEFKDKRFNESYLDLLLVTARLARKQQNFNFCSRLITEITNHYNSKSGIGVTALTDKIINAATLKNALLTTVPLMPEEKLLRMQREGTKLLQSFGDNDGACEVLLHSVSIIGSYIKDSSNSTGNLSCSQFPELNARSILNLVKYLLHDMKSINNSQDSSDISSGKGNAWNSLLSNSVSNLKKAVGTDNLSPCERSIYDLQQESIVTDSDYLIGQLSQLSIYQCPSQAKSWCSFASWCYVWGKKVVNAASSGSMTLFPEENGEILNLLPSASKEEIDSVLKIVKCLNSSSGSEWDNQETNSAENGVEEIRWQLTSGCQFLFKMENFDEIIETIVEIWKSLVKRTYSYYRMTALAYLQYLKLNVKCSNRGKSEDDNITATLRLLRLIVKHASELRDVLEDGLADTPTAPWRGIIPQLFSRLNHPEPYVRQSISDLLCRVAQASPHLIVFPAVVGSLTLKAGPQMPDEAAAGLLGAYFSDCVDDTAEAQPENNTASDQEEMQQPIPILLADDSEEDHQKTAIMQNCFAALVETLGSQDERTISEAKNLIHELHRITLLWDELWLGTLNLHQNEVTRRFTSLEKEISKVMNNSYLSQDERKEIIKEKHKVYMKPTLFLLEQLQMITSQPAETPHEQWFQKTFEKHIENTVNKLKNPSDPFRPHENWAAFKQLYQLLQQKMQQQSRSHLTMEQISPVLSSLKSTVIPMPGINKASGVVTVRSVHDVVSILPTKTKPKKLAFIGSDGHRYTYLFKGLEDLHLDERIMQFLSIVNNMFSKHKRSGKQSYYARHYSVTPLGPRSGLIQWVDGATPLFGLYKRWQQREANAVSLKNSTVNNAGGSTVLRPSEIYYNKLTPLLKEKNLNCLENRKEWPLSILLEVLKQLMEETPSDLLAKELWCSCSSALEWWNVTQTYNHSTAVMSVIGYVIGLGDRHLDNVLVDLSTGEVVHIDYNVCFEKGKNLRVPEKVPFRMTPNIVTALGLTGVEGVFRLSCEHILKVLRKGRETLLTLLEAFVYDPLVDWTPGTEGGYTGAVYGGRQAWAVEAKQTRLTMEADIAFSLFTIKVAEIKGEWIKNRDELMLAFPKLENLILEWKNAQILLQQSESKLQVACQEKALLEEAQTNPNHSLFTIPKRYGEAMIIKTAMKATKDSVNEKFSECQKWHKVHCESLATICGPELGKWCAEVSSDMSMDTLSITPVIDFLHSAGQSHLVQQCDSSENELSGVLQQRQLAMRNCIELLTTYATIVLQFGPSYKEQNRFYKWFNWQEGLLSEFSSIKCLEIISEFRKDYGRESSDSIQSAVSFHLQLQAVVTELNSKILEVLERMQIEGLDDKSTLNSYMEKTKCSLVCFLSEAGEQTHLAFLCVLGEALCTIRKQLFMMETAAGASGDRLVDLTSWNGDWFLDEIFSTCGNITQYIQLLLDSCMAGNAEFKAGFQGVKLAHLVFSALEDLSSNFQNIILPEAIQTALEPSVIEMVAKLNRIIARCGIPLEDLISELESNITSLILKTQIGENTVCDTVKKLRNEFESLMKRAEPQISDLSQGQMLLMGFNGLFTKVDSDLEALLCFLDTQPIPAAWKKLDFYKDTVALAPAVNHHAARSILKDIYFVRKLHAMQQSFLMCYEFAASLHVTEKITNGIQRDGLLISDHQLVKPVKQYTADYVRHLVLGLPTQAVGYALCLLITHLGYDLTAEIELRDVGVENKLSVEEIVLKACSSCVAKHFLDGQLPPISTLSSAFDAAWRKEDLARRLNQYLAVLRSNLQRAQLQLARFQWLNEDLLIQGNVRLIQNPAIPLRASVMSEIRKIVTTLVALDCAINSSQERHLTLTAGVEQRLKWAAGANPSLTTVQDEFEGAIAEKADVISKANQMSHDLVNLCNAILHFEALRTRTTEALSADNTFMALINRCKETCELAESCESEVSTIEEHLISLKPLPDNDGITLDWLSSVIKKVSLSLSSSREKVEQQKSITCVCWESLHLHVGHMRDLLSEHHKLMSEVRQILRTLAKNEEQELGADYKSNGQIHSYMSLYKDFSEHISSVLSLLLTDGQDLEATCLNTVESEISVLSVEASEIYNQLLELAGPIGCKLADSENPKRQVGQIKKGMLSPLYDPVSTLSPGNQNVHPRTPMRSGTPKKSVIRDPRTGKVVQEQNMYATNVWKRVKMKLDGKDPDPNKKYSISEQVDFIIKEATNMDNLAVLYEGWTPWV